MRNNIETAIEHLETARKKLVELRETNTGLGMPIFAIGTAIELIKTPTPDEADYDGIVDKHRYPNGLLDEEGIINCMREAVRIDRERRGEG